MSRVKISSKANELFKQYKKLLTKKHRDQTNQFLVHGKHLVEEASKIPGVLVEVLTSNNNQSGILLSKELMRELSIDNALYDVIGVCKKKEMDIKDTGNILVLDEIQDPSNVGTLLRTALAFGFNEVYLSSNTSDFYHEKAIRASQGAIFKLVINQIELSELYPQLIEEGYEIITTSLKGDKISTIDKINKKALVLGNEGQGVSDLSIKYATRLYKIEMENDVNSLNVGAAAAIFMYLLK